ncbi:MAG: SPOR domain-containing protein, partial [Spirochaetaceae bacterium]|nr:SPOR domain-containing protein [Spirochaetaceae bacterium]
PEELPLEDEVALVPEELPLEEEVALVPEELPLEEEVALVPEELPLEEEVALVPEELPLEEEVDPYAPIILVPAEDNPPQAHIAINPEPVVVEEETPSKEEKIASIPVPVSGIIVDSLSKLESGKYYVQIATLTQQENIDQIVQTYGTKYPIIMVPLKSGTAYQIMVGPLTVDEYGSVISKFKSFGYKDAFLRKIR